MRALVRLAAFLGLAAGFVAAVMDAARSLANATLSYGRLGNAAERLLGERLPSLQGAIERNLHPWMWDPAITTILEAPTSLALLAFGLLFWRISRPRSLAIGHPVRS